MKLNDVRPTVKSSGKMEEQFFSIQDQGMIFDILRNKMYSNPILAICREIASNARDAHREVGTPDVPIHIHVPTSLEPFYKVKDFGPGISPDRMTNIFIKYTASTKRGDNLQTGGFGLGAKTPFSYSDTFTIITVFNGMKYNYACFIDETKIGKLALFSSESTDEPNGTEIIIPVNVYNDYSTFADCTQRATKHWNVKPIVKGVDITYPDMTEILSGIDWKMVTRTGYGCNTDVFLIVDGIEYPLAREAKYELGDVDMLKSARATIYLTFGVGELTLAANREQIYLDNQTKTKIRNRLSIMKKEIIQSAQNKIEKQINLWEANICYNKDLQETFRRTDFFSSLTWFGIPLNRGYITTGCRVFSYTKGSKYTHPDRISRHDEGGRFCFCENCHLYVNDLSLSDPTSRHVKKAFDDNPLLKKIILINLTDKVTEADLNKNIHLSKMYPKRLSSITQASNHKSKSSVRLIVFKFCTESNAFRHVSYSSFEDDSSKKVIVRIKKDEYSNVRELVVKSFFPDRMMSVLANQFKDVSFYAVDVSVPTDRVKESFSDCQDFDVFLKENITECGVDFVKIKAVAESFQYQHSSIDRFNFLLDDIVNPDSIFIKRMAAIKMLQEIINDNQNLVTLYESMHGYVIESEIKKFLIDNPYLKISPFNIEFNEKYPLLIYLSYPNAGIKSELVQYINLIDAT